MKAKIQNMREWALMSAGRVRGMSLYAMSMAENAAPGSLQRRLLVKQARGFHHEYIARLIEAQKHTDGVPAGYYVSKEISP